MLLGLPQEAKPRLEEAQGLTDDRFNIVALDFNLPWELTASSVKDFLCIGQPLCHARSSWPYKATAATPFALSEEITLILLLFA